MVRLGDRPGQHAAGTTADHRRPARHRGAARRTAAGARAPPCGPSCRGPTRWRDLHGLGVVQLGQQSGQPLGEHRLPAAWWPDEVEVMPARGRDLEGAPGLVLPDDLGEVGRGCRRDGAGGGSGTGEGMSPWCSAAYRATSSSRVSTGWTRTPGTSRASAALATGTTTCRLPCGRRRGRAGGRRAPVARSRRARARRCGRRPGRRPEGSPRSRRVPRRRWRGRSRSRPSGSTPARG